MTPRHGSTLCCPNRKQFAAELVDRLVSLCQLFEAAADRSGAPVAASLEGRRQGRPRNNSMEHLCSRRQSNFDKKDVMKGRNGARQDKTKLCDDSGGDSEWRLERQVAAAAKAGSQREGEGRAKGIVNGARDKSTCCLPALVIWYKKREKKKDEATKRQSAKSEEHSPGSNEAQTVREATGERA
ncbi:unnamed protein product [Phaeothamnion confervicola]